MKTKQDVSILLPYRIQNSDAVVFLQKREKGLRFLPSYFGFFGGKIEEGEDPEEALKREIKEELDLEIKGYKFFGTYRSALHDSVVLNAYLVCVPDNFEDTIHINEGEYGKFFSEEEILNEPLMIDSDKAILKNFYNFLRQQKEI